MKHIFINSFLFCLLEVINEKLFINQTHNITANEQETVRIDCKIPNYERILNLTWSVNEAHKLAHLDDENSPVRHYLDNENRTLVITKLTAVDSGTYECFAETTSYNYITRINLDVLAAGQFSGYEWKIKQVRVEKDKLATLDCTWWFSDGSTGSLVDDTLLSSAEWFLNDTRLEVDAAPAKYKFQDSLNTLLSVSVGSIEESNDVYSCSFKLKNGTMKLSNFTLSVGGKYQTNIEFFHVNIYFKLVIKPFHS